MTHSNPDPKVIVALDFPDAQKAKDFIKKIEPTNCRLKVGKELFTRSGPDIVKYCQDKGFDVFLDLKFHDIPNTVAAACCAAAELGVWMMNVHASGGRAMMQAARKAIDESSTPNNVKPHLIAVTILTSHDEQSIHETGLNGTVNENVERLTVLAVDSGMDGVVCSAQEVEQLRKIIPTNFRLVTPGIRPEGSDKGDQQRVMTPTEAISKGSNYLVIGRPITQAGSPDTALTAIISSL
ncbi:Orotidine 5'-phosphate decarboxylase [hydrothermal vent metagenome]|uniref:Orotidine 5'-phosphate decarboxylase n=1 Tax=hydrothermal vent metagenome TaxID=652676 RepID=A0A3B0XSV6_9ZZZZ